MIPAAIIFAGGEPPLPDITEEIPEGALVIAANGGFDYAIRLGFTVHHLVGDLDSVDRPNFGDVTVERHPTNKDATDLDLALRVALRLDVERVIVVGGHGGRLDHLLANAALLCSDSFAQLDIEWLAGRARIHVVRQAVRLHGSVGESVSLLAVGETARAISTTGLVWPLVGEDLEVGSTRGVSNQMAAPVATVQLEAGVLLTVQPEAMGQ